MLRRFISIFTSPGPRYSIFYAVCLIFISTLICLPSALWLFFPERIFATQKSPTIKNIFLKTDSHAKLPAMLFSEILNLSSDQPTLLHHFSTQQAEERLQQTGVFSRLSIQKVSDDKGISIFYSLHTPLAYLGNFQNTLINHSGLCFPCYPFFKPLNLPTIFFHKDDIQHNIVCEQALAPLHLILQKLSCEAIQEIDLSMLHTYPETITIRLASGDLLRLRNHILEQGLSNYLQAKQSLHLPSPILYDLRFSDYLLFTHL